MFELHLDDDGHLSSSMDAFVPLRDPIHEDTPAPDRHVHPSVRFFLE